MLHRSDVVVVGGGNAGLCAAIRASERGKDVLVLESSPFFYRGGNTKYTRDIRYMHGSDDYTSGEYTFDEFFNDVSSVSDNNLNSEMASFVIRNSQDIPEWMSKHNIVFKQEIKGTLNLNRTNAFFIGGGKALVNSYYNLIEKLGVKVMYSAELVDMKVSDNEFKNLTAKVNGKKTLIEAKNVIICSGGFEANRKWLKEIWGSASDSFHIRGSKYNTGTPLRSLLDNGADQVGEPKGGHMVAVDARGPEYEGGIVTRIDAIPLGIVVNKAGMRFYDEGEDIWPKRYAIWGKLIAEQVDQTAYVLADSSMIGKFMPTAFPPISAGNIRDLAKKIQIDPVQLQKTVKDFNSAKKTKHDGSFESGSKKTLTPLKSHFYKPLDSPPYLAFPLKPGLTFTYLGVKIGKDTRVRTKNGEFSNIFAAGEIASGNVLRTGYLAGFGLTIGTVFGRIAGQEASSND